MPSAVSLFSGCGGFCEGIKLAGFDVKCAVEIDKHAVETYRYNFPDVPLFSDDVKKFLATGAGHEEKYGLKDIDLVFGGPPCQGYSQIGTRNLEDIRNSLYLEFARVVAKLRPRTFLMENVPNLLLLNKGHFRDKILRKFASIGYKNVSFVKVSAADFGVPQLRHRVFFFGTRDGDSFDFDIRQFFENHLASQTVKKAFTVDDAISDLPKTVVDSGETMPYPKKTKSLSAFQKMMRLDCDGKPYNRSLKRNSFTKATLIALHNHHTKEIQERRAKLIELLAPGAKADSLPKSIWNGSRPEKWRRLHPHEPAYTILAHMHRDLSEWVHPHLQRWITVREAARLQSFHDGFIFRGSEWQQLKQIGNAVPPLLGYALGKTALEVLAALHTPKSKLRATTSMVQMVINA